MVDDTLLRRKTSAPSTARSTSTNAAMAARIRPLSGRRSLTAQARAAVWRPQATSNTGRRGPRRQRRGLRLAAGARARRPRRAPPARTRAAARRSARPRPSPAMACGRHQGLVAQHVAGRDGPLPPEAGRSATTPSRTTTAWRSTPPARTSTAPGRPLDLRAQRRDAPQRLPVATPRTRRRWPGRRPWPRPPSCPPVDCSAPSPSVAPPPASVVASSRRRVAGAQQPRCRPDPGVRWRRSAQREGGPMQQTTEGAGRGRTVVVVEDNVRSRRLVRDLLELHGFGIVEAETAEEALEAIQDTRPDLVLLDIQLPGMDGVAALRVLREDPRTADVPGDRRHRLRHAGRRGAAAGGGVRRLHRQADRHPGLRPPAPGGPRGPRWLRTGPGHRSVTDPLPPGTTIHRCSRALPTGGDDRCSSRRLPRPRKGRRWARPSTRRSSSPARAAQRYVVGRVGALVGSILGIGIALSLALSGDG